MSTQEPPVTIDVEATETAAETTTSARPARDDMQPALDALCDLSQQACRQAQIYADRASDYVVRQPIKSVAMAAAAGAVLALLLGKKR